MRLVRFRWNHDFRWGVMDNKDVWTIRGSVYGDFGIGERVGSMEAISFRVPTAIIAASDITLTLQKPANAEELNNLFRRKAAENHVFGYQEDHLVSVDFIGIEESLVVDGRWTRVNSGNSVKMVLWYDNEWGYSQRVVDMVSLMANRFAV